MFTSFASEYKTKSNKTCKGKSCPVCSMKQGSNVVKICKNKKCQHVFVFKSKKIRSMQGCTTKKCPECAKHAISNRSSVCSDPACGYEFPKNKIKPNKKKTKRKPKKSKKVNAKIGHKRKNTVRVSKPFDLIYDDSGMSLELFETPPLNERNSSLELFETPQTSIQYNECQNWNGYMQDTIDDVVSSEDNEDWLQAIRNQI